MFKHAFMLSIFFFALARAYSMPPTDGAENTYVAREDRFDQVVIAVTGAVEKVPGEGRFDVPITVLNSMVGAEYKPKTVKWDLGYKYYGGGNKFEPNTCYLLALRNDGSVVWELTRKIEIKDITSPEIKLPLSPEELAVIRKKRRNPVEKESLEKEK